MEDLYYELHADLHHNKFDGKCSNDEDYVYSLKIINMFKKYIHDYRQEKILREIILGEKHRFPSEEVCHGWYDCVTMRQYIDEICQSDIKKFVDDNHVERPIDFLLLKSFYEFKAKCFCGKNCVDD